MDGLRTATKAYIAGLALLAIALTSIALARVELQGRDEAILAIGVAGSMALAWLFPIEFAAKTKFYVDTAVTVAAVLLLPPGLAMLAIGGGTLLAHGLRRGSRDDAEAIFNAAQATLVAFAASLVVAFFGWDPRRPAFGPTSILIALPIAGLVLHLCNVFLVASVAAIEARQPIVDSYRRALLEQPGVEAVAQASLVATGALAAMLADTSPWGILLLAVPLVATHHTLQRQARLRQLAERARLVSASGLDEAQRLAHLGSWEWDPATGRQVWSDETYRLLGRNAGPEAPSYHDFLAAVAPEDRTRLEWAMQDARRGVSPFELDLRIRGADGTERLIHLRGNARAAGAGPRIVGTVQDVTERVRAQEAMRRAKEAAEEADRAKSRLLSMASHDLRTPLTAVRGYLELLLGEADQLGSERREFVEIAHHNALRLSSLVNDLLDLAKIEAGRLALRIERVDLAATVQEVVAVLAPEAEAKGLRLGTAIPPGLPPVAADPGRLYQVLQNLVGNAVKFTELGGVTIAARQTGDVVEVTVADTGVGISPEALPSVFEEFIQEGDPARRGGGAGLGLAIAKRLVELHGGTIEARSAVGIGSTFTLRLPVARAEPSDPAEAPEGQPEAPPSRGSGGYGRPVEEAQVVRLAPGRNGPDPRSGNGSTPGRKADR